VFVFGALYRSAKFIGRIPEGFFHGLLILIESIARHCCGISDVGLLIASEISTEPKK
jgi:hypothetical protein